MASRGVNKVIIVGNLGNDPETRFFPDGGAITNASVATSETWKDRQTGEERERTEWHRVVFKDRGNYRLGQIAGEYLRKGSKVYVEGKLQTRKWQDQQGSDRYTTEIIVDQLQMLDPRSASDNQGYQQQSHGHQGHHYGHSQHQGQPQQQPQQQFHQSPAQGGGQPPGMGGFDDFDDDIPFAKAGDGLLV